MSIKKTIYDLHSLEFLNAPISRIYHRKKHFVNGKDLSYLKGLLSADLVQIERGFRYVYFSDISLESDRIDQRLFREQFPFLFERFANKCYSIYNADGSQKIVDGITHTILGCWKDFETSICTQSSQLPLAIPCALTNPLFRLSLRLQKVLVM